MESRSYLALGDSYTIGEQVRLYENFPYQTVQLLRNGGFNVQAPEIVAVTGFTTDELQALMQSWPLLPAYNLVTLLIGVNNQYRGRGVNHFEAEFGTLLDKAIQLAGGCPGRVWVLSIPDWGVTPFAEGRDRGAIAAEIDAFNGVCNRAAASAGAAFIDITTEQRIHGNHPEYLAADGLHPSGKEYARWAALLSSRIIVKEGIRSETKE
jgi:lysophospholipase L1-like esterase